MTNQKFGYTMFFCGARMIIRLFCSSEIKNVGQIVVFDEKQSHYLLNVLRLDVGAHFFVFDGLNGEFEVEIVGARKKEVSAVVKNKSAEISVSPDVWLLFAPLKKDKTDLVIQKSTELGVRKIFPVITDFTNCEKVRTERFVQQSIEASEQCRRTDVPQIAEPISLNKILDGWDSSRILFFLNEKGTGNTLLETMQNNGGKAAVLVGPEGGFSEAEVKKLLTLPFVKPISLGKRILRAETAVIAALSCWQAVNGDW